MRIVSALTLAMAVAVPALAQDDSVIVGGVGSGRALIDPATGETRYVPDLLQPWQDDAIRLKPPGRHRTAKPATSTATTATAVQPSPTYSDPVAPAPKHKRIAKQAAPDTSTDIPASTYSEPAAPPPKPKRVAVAKPVETPKPAAPAAKSPIRGFADIDLITGTGTQQQTQAAPPPPKAKAAAAPQPKAEAKPVKMASIQPPHTKTASGSHKDSVTFTAGASDPSGSAVASVRALAPSLSSAMGDSGRVQLAAYAGARGEKTSDTRRLSLKRALVIRQLLIDDGIPSERIDVFAHGGADDDGPLDRVDMFVKN